MVKKLKKNFKPTTETSDEYIKRTEAEIANKNNMMVSLYSRPPISDKLTEIADSSDPKISKYEFNRRYRFLLKFPESLNIQPYFVQSVNKPSVCLQTDGSYIWGNIKIKLVDPIIKSTSQIIFDKITNNPSDKFDLTLEILNPNNTAVEKWLYTDCKIIMVEFGYMDYSDSNLSIIELNIRPSGVKLEQIN